MKMALYSLFVVLSFAIAYGYIYFFSSTEEKIGVKQLIPLSFVSAIFTAILYTVIVSTAQGNMAFGLSSLGGVIGHVCSLFVCNKIKPIDSFKTISTRFMRVLPLIYGVSKLGCYFRECCGSSTVSFPLQLIEAISFVALFFIGLACHPDILIVLCCILKFGLEFFRNSNGFALTANQITCVVILIVTIGVIIYKSKRTFLCRKLKN